MPTLADLLPFIAQPMMAGPVPPMLPKATSNVTATPMSRAALNQPALSSPSDMLNVFGSLAQVGPENALRQAQANLYGLQGQQAAATIALMQAGMSPQPPMYDTNTPNSVPSATTGSAGASTGTSGSSAPAISNYTADSTMLPEQRALLDSIAGPESSGAYNVRWGGPNNTDVTFDSYADHPRIKAPGPQGPSTAAGRYQILASTWDPVANKLGLPDFTPVSQDQAGWHIAEAAYHTNTGRDLLTDLQNGDTSRVASALSGEWPTIGRGIKSYGANLAKYSSGGAAVGDATGAPAIPELPDVSLGGAGGRFAPGFGNTATPTSGSYATALTSPGSQSGAQYPVGTAGVPGAAPGAGGLVPQSLPTNNPANITLNDYSPAELALAQQRGMMMRNGLPSFPPGAAKPQSQSAANPNPTFYAPTPMPPQEAANDRAAYATPGAFGMSGPLPGLLAQAVAAQQSSPAAVAGASAQIPAAPSPANIMPAFGALAPTPAAGPGAPQISPAYLAWAQQQDRINSLLGRKNPINVEQALQLQFAGPMASAQAWGKVGPDLYTAWNKPTALRSGGVLTVNGAPIYAAPTLEKTIDPSSGREVWQYMSPTGAPVLSLTRDASGRLVPQPNGSAQPNLGVAALGPGEVEALKGHAQTLGKEYGDVVGAYQTAQKSLPNLMALQSAMTNFRTGPSADTRLRLSRAWQDFGQTVGLPPNSDLANTIANGEIINKSGTWLGFNLARSLGSREAQMIVQQSISANPNLLASPAGNEKLVGLIGQGFQRDMDKRQFFDNWFSANRNYDGAATAFDRASPVQSYISRVLPAQPTSKAAYDGLSPGTTYIAPDGSTRIKPVDPRFAQFLGR